MRNEFSVLTESSIKKADPSRLFKGVALNLQKRVSDADNMEKEFEKLTQEQKEIYALSFVVEDGSEKLSDFFRINGKPVTALAFDAVKRLFDENVYDVFEAEYNAFDSDNESVSFIQENITKADEKFLSVVDEKTVCAAGGRFIAENFEKFM